MMILRIILDFFFPRYCLMCGKRLLLEEERICIHCNTDLPRTMLWCNPTDNNLIKRFWGKIPIEKAAAYLYFYPHTNTANIVYAFKYQNEPYTAVYMGEMIAKELSKSDFFSDIDCLVPVPITSKRIRKRGYNQSERIAHGIHKVLHIPVITNAVKRTKNAVSQTMMDSSDRPDNIEQAFILTRNADKLAGKHCLVIDDVITTGSTTLGCAQEVIKVSGTKVSVLSLGYVKDKK